MDRNYIIHNNRPFTLIWYMAFGKKRVPQTKTCGTLSINIMCKL